MTTMATGAMSDHSTTATSHQDISCTHLSICHFACGGYMVASPIKVALIQLSGHALPDFATQFLSFTTAPLDPPPLART